MVVFLTMTAGLFCFISMILAPIYSQKKDAELYFKGTKDIYLINKRLQTTNSDIVLDDSIVLCRFVPVVGGEYVQKRNSEKVHIKSFMMAEIPVTYIFYNYIIHNTYPKSYDKDIYDMHYIIQWDEFLKELCNKTGRKFRLPTNAEWQYAAQGGVNNQHFIYSGSDDIDEVANYEGNTKQNQRLIVAKKKKPNNLGLFDMSGSVWELTSDKDEKNTVWPYIARGGCYLSRAEECAISAPALQCNEKNTMVGVRLVLEY